MLAALDIGNVCIQLHIAETVQALGLDPDLPIPEQIRTACNDYALGACSTGDFLRSLSAATGLSENQAAEAWNIEIGAPVPGMTEAVREFAEQGVEFVFLSDTNDLHMTKIRRTLPFAHLVKGAILSQVVGACKPDPAIYQAFEQMYGIPDIYFDDLEKNIAGAAEREWNAVRFTDAVQFRKSMEQLLCGRRG